MESMILQYAYVILPLAIIEGPMVTIVASFFASLGHLNVFLIYPLVLLGDIIGDVIHYAVGRFGGAKVIARFGKYFGITNDRLEVVHQKYFSERNSLWKTITISKVTHAPSSLIMFASGLLRVDFANYMVVTTVNNIFKVLFFVLVGYFFGESYMTISRYIANSWMVMLPIFIVVFYILYGRKRPA